MQWPINDCVLYIQNDASDSSFSLTYSTPHHFTFEIFVYTTAACSRWECYPWQIFLFPLWLCSCVYDMRMVIRISIIIANILHFLAGKEEKAAWSLLSNVWPGGGNSTPCEWNDDWLRRHSAMRNLSIHSEDLVISTQSFHTVCKAQNLSIHLEKMGTF